jgi:penicillin-binding protein 1B
MATSKKARTRKRAKPLPIWRHRSARVALAAAAALFILALALLAGPYWRLSAHFRDRPLAQPSRLYGRPPLLAEGSVFSREQVVAQLEQAGYRRAGGGEPGPGELLLPPGRPARLVVELRSFPTPHGRSRPARLEAVFAGRFVRSLHLDGEPVPSVWLEPSLLASYYGPERRERRPWRMEEIPEHLVRAVLAAEDASFFDHPGLSVRGIVRALWSNLRGGTLQGGSTLTQQLVKNLYLSPERSFARKVPEAALALLLEMRHDKEEILLAYLNEIYWGRVGRLNLMGAGAAAWAYFGKDASQLTLYDSALLAGMIQSPNRYSPLRHPQAAKERRDWVLERMAKLGWLEESALPDAQTVPIEVAPRELDLGLARHAADALAAEVEERWGIDGLADRGYVLFSTLEVDDQRAAEEAVRAELEALEKGGQAPRGEEALQAALLSVDPRSGEILAYVGGRDYRSSQFDRVRQAHRQPGSVFKTFVYLAAFADRTASPSTLLEDRPLTVVAAGRSWSPRNSDDTFHGTVTARTALEQSINVPTVRLAQTVGLRRVVDWARALGIESPLEPVPSLALGAFEVTPLELLRAYATLAAGGRRPTLHGVEAVFDLEGRLLEGRPVPPPAAVLEPDVAYVTTSVLQGVLDRGTGRSVRWDGVTDAMAGKTGTTNSRRDNWFVGYSPDRATLVWVGYDDGSATRLSGARAALPIWSRFTRERRPPLGYETVQPPPGVMTVTIDPASGGRATGRCPEILTEVFLYDQAPTEQCELHGRRGEERRRFFERLFGRRRGRPVI